MQTYSHFIMTAIINRWLKPRLTESQKVPPVNTTALMLGSIMPDLPLIVMGVSLAAYDVIRGVEFGPEVEGGAGQQSMVGRLFDDWFFNSPWVIAPHNLFHSPLLVVIYIALGYGLWKWGHDWAGWLFWLASASLLHTLIDIPIHYNDGPLLLFPLNWEWRFYSPISYWDPDPQRHGTPFAIMEHLFVLMLLSYLLVSSRKSLMNWLRRHLGLAASA